MNYAGNNDFEWHYDCINLFATFNSASSPSTSQYGTSKRISQVLIFNSFNYLNIKQV